MKVRNYSLVIALVACLSLMSLVVKENGDLQVGTELTAIYNDIAGRFGSASGWDFNPNSTIKGLLFENGQSESAGLYVDGDYAVIWSPGDNDRLLRIYDEDNMSPGSTTYERAYFNGSGTLFQISDEKQKRDIANIGGAMSKINKINGVNYRFKKSATASKSAEGKSDPDALHPGFLAQNVEASIPEVVSTDEHGNKFVNYDGMIPYLVEALKEQKAEIDLLKSELARLKEKR
jgi:hypothetical protein